MPEALKPKRHFRDSTRGRVTITAAFVVLVCIVVSAGLVVKTALDRARNPSCLWPLRIHGEATAVQAGLVRCYLQALAHQDSAKLMALASDDPPVHITEADLRYSRDARAGEAAAAFVHTDDEGYVDVTIAFANGVIEKPGIVYNGNSIAPCNCWRMDIGTFGARSAKATASPPS